MRRTPWWNQGVKEAIRAKKVTYKVWLANKSLLDIRSHYSEARKAVAAKVKLPKLRKDPVRKFGEWIAFGKR